MSYYNKTIRKNIFKLDENKYMTITAFAVFDGGKVHFSGLHQDILIYRKKEKSVEVIPSEGMWIGMIDDITKIMKDDEVAMNSVDVMLLYTDGITEAWPKGKMRHENVADMYGDDKLVQVLAQYGEGSPEDVKNGVLKSMDQFQTNDDVTMVVVKKV